MCRFKGGLNGLCFNTQPPEGGWVTGQRQAIQDQIVSTHSCLKAAGQPSAKEQKQLQVSTHSRLKAAGSIFFGFSFFIFGFNTQPPEGGWMTMTLGQVEQVEFQHTAA